MVSTFILEKQSIHNNIGTATTRKEMVFTLGSIREGQSEHVFSVAP